MAITRPTYCTREQVKRALDVAETARNHAQVDQAIESATDEIEGRLHRRFYPEVATRYFDWPNMQHARPWRLWLDDNDLISVTTLTSGTATIVAADYFLRRSDGKEEPPYTHIELDLAASASFGQGNTHQRDIAIFGLWGHSNTEASAGVLENAIATTTTTTVDVTNSAAVGVGDVFRVDSERMLVTDRAMLDTGQNIGGNLTAAASGTTVAVTDGTAYFVDEVLLVDSERMLVVDIAGNNLTVKRAWDGSVLAAHSIGADIYAPRRLTVTRGALGTTAATHADAAAVSRHVKPPLIRSLGVAESIAQLQQETSAYGRTVGAGESEREARGVGLAGIRAEAYTRFGRKARTRAI